jgi:GNAT superfamily N-acetyltransferase
MNEDLVIRALRREDYEQWKPLWLRYNAFYKREGTTALPEVVTTATWSRFFDGYEPMHAAVAERSGGLVGLVHYLYHRSTTSIEPVCYLQDLFTAETERGRGVGRALIENVYREAKEGGAARVYWLTHETNSTAMLLYDKMADKPGFVVYRKPF